MNIFLANKTKFIASLLLINLSLSIPILYSVYTPDYTNQNTLEDQGTIASIEVNRHIVGKTRTNMVVYVLDNGNRYYIPSGFNPFVDSFDFEQKGTQLTLRYDPHKIRDNAYIIASLCDNEETFLSLRNTNRYERLSRILGWILYLLGCLVFILAFWLGDFIKAIDTLKKQKKHKENVMRKRKKREQIKRDKQ